MIDEECKLNGCLYDGDPENVAEKMFFVRSNCSALRQSQLCVKKIRFSSSYFRLMTPRQFKARLPSEPSHYR
jgi:hypothetical protein